MTLDVRDDPELDKKKVKETFPLKINLYVPSSSLAWSELISCFISNTSTSESTSRLEIIFRDSILF